MRRHLVYPMDFDTRASMLNTVIGEDWEPQVQELWRNNQASLTERLRVELGDANSDEKLQNFKDLDNAPFSIVWYHNALYHQVRHAFCLGLYYPALVGACALGERMLNHVVLDLRDAFRATPEYKDVYRKESFSDWDRAIDVLSAWNVFQRDDIAGEFKALAALRHRSIHFNQETYASLRDDALAALRHLGTIIGVQFGFAAGQRWMLPARKVTSSSAKNPRQTRSSNNTICDSVLWSAPISFADGILFFDQTEYAGGDVSDEEFARLFNDRPPDSVVSTALPTGPGIVVHQRSR